MQIVPIPAFKDNYIWAMINDAQQVLIVDPGDAVPVIQFLTQQNLKLAGILITHHHWDHTNGISELLQHAKVPVFGPAHDPVPEITIPLSENQQAQLSGFPLFSIIDIPGHTLGHIAYYADGVLFAGDTLFAGGCGRIFEGTAAQMYSSLLKLKSLPGETKLYCAHEYTLANLRFALHVEPKNDALIRRYEAVEKLVSQTGISLPSQLSDEIQTNPFLRCQLSHIKHSAELYARQALKSEAEVFAVIREWKNKS